MTYHFYRYFFRSGKHFPHLRIMACQHREIRCDVLELFDKIERVIATFSMPAMKSK